MKTKVTHNELVINYMKKFGSITALEAMRDIGCMRLASRISEIEDMGFVIGRDWEKVKNRFGSYTRVKRYWIIKEVAA